MSGGTPHGRAVVQVDRRCPILRPRGRPGRAVNSELLRQAAGVDDPDRRVPPTLAKRLDGPSEPERTPLDEIRDHIQARKNRRPF